MNPPQGQPSSEPPAKKVSPLWQQLMLHDPFWETREQAELLMKEERERQERERQDRETQERERLKAMPPLYVITMVHGTQLSRRLFGPLVSLFKWPRSLYREFQDGPPWVQPHSPLAEYLTKELGWRVRIEPFSWKGYNTVDARAVAADELRKKLCELQKQYPDAEQVIIAHSHGGNVALSALADADDARRILGVATLATPFLTARVRNIKGLLDAGDAIAAALMAGFATLAIGLARGNGWSWWPWAIVVCVSVVLLMLGGVWATKKMKKTAGSIASNMRKTELATEQVTIFRTYGDEAVAVIAGARVTGAFVNLVWHRISEPVLRILSGLLELIHYFGLRSIVRKFEEEWDKQRPRSARSYRALQDYVSTGSAPPGKPSSLEPIQTPYSTLSTAYQLPKELSFWEHVKNAVLPMIGPLIVTAFQDPKYPFLKWVILGIAAIYGLPALLALLVTLISVIPGIVFSIGLLPCGWTVPLTGPYLDVTAEPAPPGSWRVTQFAPDGEKGLAHSKSYDDWRVHQHLAAWIKERAQAKQESENARLA